MSGLLTTEETFVMHIISLALYIDEWDVVNEYHQATLMALGNCAFYDF